MTPSSTAPSIPLTRLDDADPVLMEELLAAVECVARASAFILGAEVESFEAEFASYCDAPHAIGLSSGTDALILALRALGIGPGDEVIVPANSFIATAEAVSLVGATPRFVDVDPATALVTRETIEPAIGPRTRCLIPVHLYGRMVDLDPILALACERGLAVVEDACQAHGALLDGRRAGSMADAGCFSFYPAKNLGAWGDAGALVTADAALADRVRLLRSHGERPRYEHQVVGSTSRLDALQAAVLRIKLRRLDEWNDGRRRAGAALSAALAGGPVRTPAPVHAGGDHVFHQYVIETGARDALREWLADRGIASAIHYPRPIHLAPAYAGAGAGLRPGSLPVAEGLAKRICSLPMYPGLAAEDVARVAEAVLEFDAAG